ncbi:MAG: FAD-dependent oxidoreductase [bacterium]
MDATGLFVFIGFTPNTDLTKDPVEKDKGGFIITNQNMQSSVSGLFVAGDCRVQLIRQTSNAVGDVTTAAVAAEKHLEAQEEAKKQKGTFAAAA